MPPSSTNIESLFAHAITLSRNELVDFLEEVGEHSAELCEQLKALLDADEQNQESEYLEWPSEATGPDQTNSAAEQNIEKDPMIGRLVSGCRIVERIGSGFSGVLYRAEPTQGDNPKTENGDSGHSKSEYSERQNVAIKFLRTWNHDAQGIARFRQEASSLSRLQHDNIARLISSGELDGTPYLVMVFVPGITLTQQLANHPETDLKTRLRWFGEICNAIAYAHQNQIIHRDVKPSNVIITKADSEGTQHAIVTDFGIAKSLNPDSTYRDLTQTGELLGTPRFMAPEQIEGKNVNTLADVYGLGAILYFLLTGQPPFSDVPIHSVPASVLKDRPIDPSKQSQLAAKEKDLEVICLKCLSIQPEARYQSVAELLAEIERWRNKRPIHAKKPSVRRRIKLWIQANPRVAVLSVSLLTTVIAAMLGLTILWLQAKQASQTAELERKRTQQSNEELLSMLQGQIDLERELRGNPYSVEARIGMLRNITNGFESMEERLGPLDDQILETSAVAWYNLARFEQSFRFDIDDKAKQKSREQFEELARRFPSDSRHRFSLFHWHNLFGSPDDAYQTISQLAEDYPDNQDYANCLSAACYLRGRLLFMQGNFKEADELLTEGISTTKKLLENGVGDKQALFEKNYIQHYLFRARNNWARNLPAKAQGDIEQAVFWSERVLSTLDSDLAVRQWHASALRFNSASLLSNQNLKQATENSLSLEKSMNRLRPLLGTKRQLWGSCGKIILQNWMIAKIVGNEVESKRWAIEMEKHFEQWKAQNEYMAERAFLFGVFLIGSLKQDNLSETRKTLEFECADLPEDSNAELFLAIAERDIVLAQKIIETRSNASQKTIAESTFLPIYQRLVNHLRDSSLDSWVPFTLTEREKSFALAWSGYRLQFQIDSLNHYMASSAR